MAETKYYFKDILCRNCGIEQSLTIPFGTTVYQFLSTKKCDKCGCLINGADQIVYRTKNDRPEV